MRRHTKCDSNALNTWRKPRSQILALSLLFGGHSPNFHPTFESAVKLRKRRDSTLDRPNTDALSASDTQDFVEFYCRPPNPAKPCANGELVFGNSNAICGNGVASKTDHME